MTGDQHAILIKKLLDKSRVRELAWKEGIYTNSFQISFRNNAVLVQPIKGRHPANTDYEFMLLNDQGEVVDSFTDEDLKNVFPNGPAFGESWYAVCKEIYDLARRRALGADKVMEEILTELDDDLPF